MPWIFQKSDIMTDAGNLNTDFPGILNTNIVAATLSCSLVFLLLFFIVPPLPRRFIVNALAVLICIGNRMYATLTRKNSSYGIYWYLYSYHERYALHLWGNKHSCSFFCVFRISSLYLSIWTTLYKIEIQSLAVLPNTCIGLLYLNKSSVICLYVRS